MSLIFITGADLSAVSGVPNYTEEIYVDSLSTKKDYLETKDRLNQWKEEVSTKEPNKGHYEITNLIETYGGLVLTQNIDNLQEKSRLDPKYVIHLYGSLFEDIEGEPGLPNVVLSDEEIISDFSITQCEILDDCAATIIIGTSSDDSVLYQYIDWHKPLIVCNKEEGFKVPEKFIPVNQNIYYLYGNIESNIGELRSLIRSILDDYSEY